MRVLSQSFSLGVLLMLCALCPCATAKAQVPKPAQIITDGDWIVEKVGGATKSGDKFVMRFDQKKKVFRTVVIEEADTQEVIENKRRALAQQNPPRGKWRSENGKIYTERFIDKWTNEITVDGMQSFRMISKGGGDFRGKLLTPIPQAEPPPPAPSPPPAVQPAVETR